MLKIFKLDGRLRKKELFLFFFSNGRPPFVRGRKHNFLFLYLLFFLALSLFLTFLLSLCFFTSRPSRPSLRFARSNRWRIRNFRPSPFSSFVSFFFFFTSSCRSYKKNYPDSNPDCFHRSKRNHCRVKLWCWACTIEHGISDKKREQRTFQGNVIVDDSFC